MRDNLETSVDSISQLPIETQTKRGVGDYIVRIVGSSILYGIPTAIGAGAGYSLAQAKNPEEMIYGAVIGGLLAFGFTLFAFEGRGIVSWGDDIEDEEDDEDDGGDCDFP